MRGPSAKAALAVVVAAFLVSCASTTGNDGSTPTTTAPVSESTETSRPPESNGASTGATEATIALVLAEQITSLGGANGEEPTCTDEAEVFVDPGEAGVWLLQGPEATETVAMPFAIRLCLAGFASGSVTLDVEVGGDTYQSTLVLEGQSDEGVFTGRVLRRCSWTVPRFACRHWTRASTRATAGNSFRHQPYVTSSPSRVE